MIISTISDIHLKKNDYEARDVWEKFVHSKEVSDSDTIILLGDIFDLMIGEKKSYLEYYSFFFESIKYLIMANKKIIYLEGNHDFHLENTFQLFIKKYNLNSELFEYKKNEFNLTIENQIYLFCHGDIVDYKNESFKKWKNIYSSEPFKFLVNKILPFTLIKNLGEKASKDSKKRNSKEFSYEKAKALYREGAEYIFKLYQIDYLIAGHTHIHDVYEFGDRKYLNNGFPKRDRKFIHIKNGKPSLISLEDSFE